MTSIVMAAHNEAAVIGATLDALLADPCRGTEIVVVPNGCTDDTAGVARRRGARVVDLPTAGKAAALNVGDEAATSFPRIYLDADIIVPPGGIAAVASALEDTGALAAVPERRLCLAGRPWLVRAYFSINQRLPVFRRGLFGRGLVALSEEGRARFETFPSVVADDLFLDSLFADDERVTVPEVRVLVETPYSTRALIDVLARVRRGNAALRALARSDRITGVVRPPDRWAWLRDVTMPNPWLAPAAVAYVAVSGLAALKAARGPRHSLAWGRDESTRSPRTAPGLPVQHE